MELAEIYLVDLEYEKAAFCYEELILLNPANFLIHQVQRTTNLKKLKK